jgi:hypothetical protein
MIGFSWLDMLDARQRRDFFLKKYLGNGSG